MQSKDLIYSADKEGKKKINGGQETRCKKLLKAYCETNHHLMLTVTAQAIKNKYNLMLIYLFPNPFAIAANNVQKCPKEYGKCKSQYKYLK